MHDGWMFGMAWFWILVLILVAVGIWAAFRGGALGGPRSRAGSQERSPEDVLRERLARGEIDENEYESRLEALRDKR